MTDYTERAREWLERQAASNLTISGDAASLANLLSQIERETYARVLGLVDGLAKEVGKQDPDRSAIRNALSEAGQAALEGAADSIRSLSKG